MNDVSIYDFINSELEWALEGTYEINIRALAEDLAESLKINGYCSDPYFEYDKALICPINKKREKYCGCTHCTSHEFCVMLRKEGYV
jgi:hypothetical protein